MSEPLHTKYRPKDFSEVAGHKEVVRSITKSLSGDAIPHAFLFLGPSGVGKTTLARILAEKLGCMSSNLIEVDAATYGGVDQLRSLVEMSAYRPIDGGNRVILIDEVQAISKAGWQSLLKTIEEPPAHSYWCLCTTEADKVPDTIKTRCHSYNLRPIARNDILTVLEQVAKREKIKLSLDLLGLVAERAEGSMRRALVYLSTISSAADRKEALQLMDKLDDEDDAILFVRELVTGKGFEWRRAMKRLKDLQEAGVSAETLRAMLVNYCNSLLLSSTGMNDAAMRALTILDSLSGKVFLSSDKFAPILLMVGSMLAEG